MRSKETDALDRLYAAPLEEFAPLRRALAAELRAKEPAAARRLEHAAKPTRTAWALDQVARREPRLLEALVAAHDAAAEAQKRGDAASVLRTSRGYREAVAAVVRAAREVLEGAGFAATAAQARRMAETLQVAAAQPSEARRQLLAGWLARDVTMEDPLAGLEIGPPRGKPGRAAKTTPGPDGRADGHAGARRLTALQEREKAAAERRAAALRAKREREAARKAARERLAALEAEASAARAEARRAEIEATRARDAAERARRKAFELDARLRREKQQLKLSS